MLNYLKEAQQNDKAFYAKYIAPFDDDLDEHKLRYSQIKHWYDKIKPLASLSHHEFSEFISNPENEQTIHQFVEFLQQYFTPDELNFQYDYLEYLLKNEEIKFDLDLEYFVWLHMSDPNKLHSFTCSPRALFLL